MRTRFAVTLVALSVLNSSAVAQPPEAAPAAPWAFAHDLRIRPAGEAKVTPATPRVGVEVYRDGPTQVALTSAGGLAVAPAGTAAGSRVQWLFAHDLKFERGGKPAQMGVEAFRETSSNSALYATQTGLVALADAPGKPAADGDAEFRHSLALQVRAATEDRFGSGSKRVAVECFRDERTGAAIYTSDAGFAVLSKPSQPAAGAVQAPVALYGLSVRVRKPATAPATGVVTAVLGVEVYSDPNTGGLLYVSETGSLAVAPAAAEPGGGQGATWMRGFAVAARPGGSADFKDAKPVTVEVYADPNSGNTLYVTDSGAIAVLAKK